MRVRHSSSSRATGSWYVLLLRLRSVHNAPCAQANFVCVMPMYHEKQLTNPAWRTVVTAYEPRTQHFEGVKMAPIAAASGPIAGGAVGFSADAAAANSGVGGGGGGAASDSAHKYKYKYKYKIYL